MSTITCLSTPKTDNIVIPEEVSVAHLARHIADFVQKACPPHTGDEQNTTPHRSCAHLLADVIFTATENLHFADHDVSRFVGALIKDHNIVIEQDVEEERCKMDDIRNVRNTMSECLERLQQQNALVQEDIRRAQQVDKQQRLMSDVIKSRAEKHYTNVVDSVNAIANDTYELETKRDAAKLKLDALVTEYDKTETEIKRFRTRSSQARETLKKVKQAESESNKIRFKYEEDVQSRVSAHQERVDALMSRENELRIQESDIMKRIDTSETRISSLVEDLRHVNGVMFEMMQDFCAHKELMAVLESDVKEEIFHDTVCIHDR